MAFIFTDANFEEEALQSEIPVLVDFYADWCGPCKMIAPIIEQLSEEYDGKVKIGKVNTDDNRDLAGKYNVMSIPTLVFIKNGEVVETITGALPKAALESKLNELV